MTSRFEQVWLLFSWQLMCRKSVYAKFIHLIVIVAKNSLKRGEKPSRIALLLTSFSLGKHNVKVCEI